MLVRFHKAPIGPYIRQVPFDQCCDFPAMEVNEKMAGSIITSDIYCANCDTTIMTVTSQLIHKDEEMGDVRTEHTPSPPGP